MSRAGDAPDPGAALQPGRLVRSTAGRDRGALYVVVGLEGDRYLLLADGRARPVKRPKRKNVRHVQPVAWEDPRIAEAFAGGRPPGDDALRELLNLAEKGGGRKDGTQG